MLNKLRERAQGESGFTLIELLVVMLIIGLLAAIAIPSFFNQRDKAKDSDAKEQVRTAQTAVETYATDNNGSYTSATNAKLVAIESTLSPLNGTTPRLTTTPTSDGKGYTVKVDAVDTGNSFSITRASGGGVTYTCTVSAKGGCPSGGNWN